MYDMYPWDSANQGDYPPEPLRSWRNPSPATPRETSPAQPNQAARAVQVALDRRDNGGDAAVPHAAAPHAADANVTRPTASRTRQ